MELQDVTRSLSLSPEQAQERLRGIIALHFDPQEGSAYWIDRAKRLGIDPLRQIRRFADLAIFGEMRPADLCGRPLLDYIPWRFHHRLDRMVLAQGDGGVWTAYREDELDEAFVVPFVSAAYHAGFPAQAQWLYVGPGTLHAMHRLVRRLAASLGGLDPFSFHIDTETLEPQSAIYDALEILRRQPITVICAPPRVLAALCERMTTTQRDQIRGVLHFGWLGHPDELIELQARWLPRAVHLSTYWDALWGCCPQIQPGHSCELDYFPYGGRLYFEVISDNGHGVLPGQVGRLRFTRLDETSLIIRMVNGHQAALLPPPMDGPQGFISAGIRNPAG